MKKQRGTFRQAREDWKARQQAQRAPSGATAPPCALVPPPPSELNAAEAATWRTLGDAINLLGTYTAADGPAFALLVFSWLRASEALAGRLMEIRDGELVPVNYSTVATLVKTASGLAQRFGLDPAARSRLSIAPAPAAPSAGVDPDDLSPIGPEQ